MLESNRTGRIIYNPFFFFFSGRCVVRPVHRENRRKTTERKRKGRKLVIFNAYLWRCNMAREIEIEKRQEPFLFSLVLSLM